MKCCGNWKPKCGGFLVKCKRRIKAEGGKRKKTTEERGGRTNDRQVFEQTGILGELFSRD